MDSCLEDLSYESLTAWNHTQEDGCKNHLLFCGDSELHLALLVDKLRSSWYMDQWLYFSEMEHI
jgi:hypothetical protein